MITKTPPHLAIREELSELRRPRVNNFDAECGILRDATDVLTQLPSDSDDSRILGLLAAHPEGESKLRGSLPRLIRQMNEIGLKLDLLLAGNCGAHFDRILMEIDQRNDVTIHYGRQHSEHSLAAGFDVIEMQGSNERMYIHDETRVQGHRIFFVHQPNTPSYQGKIIALRALCSMVINSIADGTYRNLASLALELDAESWICLPGQLDSNGLSKLVQQKKEQSLHSISPWNQFSHFRPTRDGAVIPDLDKPTDKYYAICDEVQVFQPYLHGACTLGDTLDRIAMYEVIGNRFQTLNKDKLITALTHGIGRKWTATDQCRVLNCVSTDSIGHLGRWVSGERGLRRLLGDQPFSDIRTSVDYPQEILNKPEYEELCRRTSKIPIDDPLYGCTWTPNPVE